MNTSLNQPTAALLSLLPTWSNRWSARYDALVDQLEIGNYRLVMQAAMLIVQGNLIAPVALLLFQHYDFGYQDYFAGLAGLLFFGVLVANLALLPVRQVLRIFWLNVATHASLIAWHLLR